MLTPRARRIVIGIALAVVAAPTAALVVLSFLSTRAPRLGVRDGRLLPCPDRPNCVSTQAVDPRRAMEPIRFTGSADAAMGRLRRVLQELPRATIVVDEPPYIHAEARSLLFRFVDDLEFLVDETEGTIHFRLASRVGRSDLGVNRRRAEAIRSAFEAIGKKRGE